MGKIVSLIVAALLVTPVVAQEAPVEPTVGIEVVNRLERRILQLEQQLRVQQQSTADPTEGVASAMLNLKKNYETGCKKAGGRWAVLIPVSPNPKKQEELKDVFYGGCVGR